MHHLTHFCTEWICALCWAGARLKKARTAAKCHNDEAPREPRLSALTAFLSKTARRTRVLDGRVEAFSCKRAGEDKKLAKELEAQFAAESRNSPSSMEASSPLGALAQPATRRLLVDLIATLNASFPDHDFSNLRPEQFCREAGAQFAVRACATSRGARDAEQFRAPGGGEFLDELWAAIEEAIQLRECEVYSYVPDGESDPFSEGALWSFNYFFFNKRLKRIVYLSCVARSRQLCPSPFSDVEDEYRIRQDDSQDDFVGGDLMFDED